MASMMHLVQSVGLPHWLTLAGALLVMRAALALQSARRRQRKLMTNPSMSRALNRLHRAQTGPKAR